MSWVDNSNGLPEGYTPPSASLTPPAPDIYAAARETAETAAAREAERAMAWAAHVADALLVVEEAGDE